ncbi:MAG TPA: TolC family protein [Bryobacteraceae bacterium]|nr:TolC family protein [Bryobacteraceae bacterium]
MTFRHLLRVLGFAELALLIVQTGLAEVRHITLQEAIHLAISQNHALKIARLKVEENQQKKAGEHSSYFPSLTNQSNLLHVTDLETVSIPPGGLGHVGSTLIPAGGVSLLQGNKNVYSSGTMLSQSLTQLIRIRQQNRMAAAEVAISRDDVKKSEDEIAVQVHTVYYGILIAELQKKAAQQQIEYANENLRESEEDVRKGSALKVAAIGGRADVLGGQQSVLTADLQIADLKTELDDLLGLPLNTQLELDPAVPTSFDNLDKAEYLKIAWSENPEILSAQDTATKARAGVAAAKTAYIPDITAYARHSYQDGVPFLVHNFGTFGVTLSYDVFDFGKRRANVRAHEDALAEAEENLRKLKDDVAVSIEQSYHKMERTKSMVDVARQVVALRDENDRLAGNQLTYGVVQVAERRQASAARYKAQADLLQASLGYLLARAELEQAIGRTPGL